MTNALALYSCCYSTTSTTNWFPLQFRIHFNIVQFHNHTNTANLHIADLLSWQKCYLCNVKWWAVARYRHIHDIIRMTVDDKLSNLCKMSKNCLVLSNNTSLSEYWKEYRNGQASSSVTVLTVTIRVPIFRQRCLILFIKHMNSHDR